MSRKRCLHDDINEGFVWLKDDTLPPRSIVKLTNPVTGDSVRCEALQIEPNFIRLYNHKPRISITDPSAALVISSFSAE